MLLELQLYIWMLLKNTWSRWLKSPPAATVVGFYVGVFFDMKVYLGAIAFLVIMDMFTGIAASLHRGEKFSSRKLRTGLLERAILYIVLFNVTLMLDVILRNTINYGRDYIAIFCCTLIGFYEASSCIENLVSRFPKYSFLQRIGKALNLIEKSYEDSTVNKVATIIQATQLKENEK